MTPETLKAFEKAHETVKHLIFYWAHKFKSNTPGCEFEDLCQTGETKLVELFVNGSYKDKSEEELLKIIRRSIQTTMVDALRKKAPVDSPVVRVDLDEVANLTGESGFEQLYLQHLVDYLGHFVSSEAKLLMQNLVCPGDEIHQAEYIQTLRRKHIQAQGHKVAIATKLTHNFVGGVLGFSQSKTKALIHELQQAYCQHVVPLQGALCPRLYPSLMQS